MGSIKLGMNTVEALIPYSLGISGAKAGILIY
jgi:hypothetical protein